MSRLTLYERALGSTYLSLPTAVQRFHRLTGHNVLHGWVETHAPGSLLAWILALGLGTPRGASSGPLRFEIDAAPQTESWTRHFPSRTMTSRVRLVAGHVAEQVGIANLTFKLTATPGALKMELVKMRVLGIPCPKWLLPHVVADELGIADQLHFQVCATLPLVGVVASYRGHLDVHPKERS